MNQSKIDQPVFRAYAPASIGNFSVGFDLLGAAIAPVDGPLLGDVVEATPAPTYALRVTGTHAQVVPVDPAENLVTKTYLRFVDALHQRRLPSQPLALTLHKNLPVASGLGSSAASIVATLLAVNHACDKPLTTAELLMLAAELEGNVSGSPHFDNVAPSLLGGLQLMTGLQTEPARTLPFPDDWLLVVSFPGTAVSTRAARQAVPRKMPVNTAIAYARNLANFIHLLHTGEAAQAATFVRDVVAEPHRLSLLPGYEDFAHQAREAGALAVGISGSGPTVFALCENMTTARELQQLALATYCASPDEDKDAFSHICQLDQTGARLL